MIAFQETKIEDIILHKVGNKNQEEGIRFSKSTLDLDEMTKNILMTYFLSPFKSEEFYNLYHESELQLNAIYSFVSRIFEEKDLFYDQSVNIAKHLYEQSTHPKVKSGELYITYLTNCYVNGEEVDAIGLFKSESRDTFLKIYPTQDSFSIESDDGININRLDKGCIIYNLEGDSGYMVSVVDNSSKGAEAVYWINDFLKVRSREDNYYHTQNVMNLCKSFVAEKMPEEFEVNKAEQADLLNRSVKYLKEKENFNLEEYTNEVMGDPQLIESFNNYKNNFEEIYDTNLSDEFEISPSAFKKTARVMKSVIKLDKNFHIYVHGNREYIIRGYDEKRGLNYYQVFFNEER